MDGRWLSRDFASDLINSYTFCRNAINIFDVKGLSTIVIWFTQPEDGEQRNKFLKHVRNHKSNIIKWVTEIKEKANIVSEQSKTCRNNTELFDWLRCQGVNILWDNSRFNGSFDEFIKKIEDDEVVLHTRKMSETETLETLKESLVSQISMYDKSIVMGHSTNSKSFDKPYFRIRKQRSKEVLVDQGFFSFADMLITCFQGDNNMRTWFLTPANHQFEVELYPVSGTLCHHVKEGTISYTPIKIEIKILGSNIEIPEINDLGLDGIELPFYEVQPVVFP